MRRFISKILTLLLSVIIVISITFPEQLAQDIADKIEDIMFAKAAMVIGETGSMHSQQCTDRASGIVTEAFRMPPIRVSIWRNKAGKLEVDKGLEKISDRASIGFPDNLTGSLYFVKPEVRATMEGKPVSIGEANTSNKTLTLKSDQNILDNIITLQGSPNDYGRGDVYYQEMKSMGMEQFKQNWRSIANKTGLASAMINHLFNPVPARDGGDYNEYFVDDHIEEVYNRENADYNNVAGWDKNTYDNAYMHYLDLLLTFYTVAADENKEVWGQAIDDYLTGDNLDESPVTICIDSVGLIGFNYREYMVMIPSIDYLNFTTGIEKQFAIDDTPWWLNTKKVREGTQGNSYVQLERSAQLSVQASPNFKRISERYDENNGFSHATAAFTTGALRTTNETAYWEIPFRNAETDYFDMFYLKNPVANSHDQRGYMLAPAPTEPITGGGEVKVRLKAEPDGEVVETKNIGKPVSLTVSSILNSQECNKWNHLIDVAKQSNMQFNVTFNFKRTSSDTTASIAVANNPETLVWSPDEFREFINGNRPYIKTDDTSGISIEGKTKIEFNYTVEVTITVNGKQYKGDAQDPASFIKIAPKVGYTSKPEAYSELKNYGKNSNMSGKLDEDWEAMAGVPSTEQLYFAAGGSEFIVDISVEYVQDEVAKRSYESRFGSVDCEFKQGDTAKSVTVPSPTGATSSNLTVDPHAGGTVYAEWHYTVKNNSTNSGLQGYNPGSSGSPCPGNGFDPGNPGDITWQNIWTADVYNNAVKNAKAFQSKLNAYIIKHTAASDKRTRQWNGWNASLSGNSWGDSISTTEWEGYTKQMGKPGYGTGYVEGLGHGAPDIPAEPPSGTPGEPGYKPGKPGKKNNHKCGTFHPATKTTVTKVSDKSFTIRVSANVPAHVICGPCCSHVLPAIEDTWAQTWKYDSMKIADVHVWKIDQGAVNGLEDIISADVVGAEIVKGRPNIFYNIALKNDSKFTAQDGKGKATGSSRAGRVRYSLDTVQHDEVIYSNGTRTNKCDGLSTTYGSNVSPDGGAGHGQSYATGFIYNAFNPGTSTHGATRTAGQTDYPTNQVNYLVNHTDAKDKATPEYQTFYNQRNKQVTPTMITDFLILQTSSGDQAVMYFHKTSTQPATAEAELPNMDANQEEMWDNNSNSASKWEEDHINVGSYNGKYSKPNEKFTWDNEGNAPRTFFDPDPAGTIIRPTRAKDMMLYEGELNIILENKNKSYKTGEAEVFWKNELHWTDRSSPRYSGVTNPMSTAPYKTDMRIGPITGYDFKTGGYITDAPYSDEHLKINDIIIQDPVSTEDFAAVSLPESRDQRVGEVLGGSEDVIKGINDSGVCPGDPALCDFRVLNCTYFEDTVLADFDFSTLDSSGRPLNKVTNNSLVLPSGFTLQGGALRAFGTRVAIPFSELYLSYQSSVKLRVEADVTMSQQSTGVMIFSFHGYDLYVPANQQYACLNTGNGWERKIMKPIADGKKHHILVDFSFNSVDSCRVTIDGTEYPYQRINASGDITAQRVGSNLYIGCWELDNIYPARFIIDNFKVTRLAGTAEHNEDCYKMVMTHPSGLNAHRHTVDCLGDLDWFVDGVANGSIPDNVVRKMLGDAYEPVMANAVGESLYVWDNWTSGNMKGFENVSAKSFGLCGNNIRVTASGSWDFRVPVKLRNTDVIQAIRITLDNNSDKTVLGVNTQANMTGYVSGSMKPNKANQVVTFRPSWTGAKDYIYFDVQVDANVTIKKIELFGVGDIVPGTGQTTSGYNFGDGSKNSVTHGYVNSNVYSGDRSTPNGLDGTYHGTGNINMGQVTNCGSGTQHHISNGGYSRETGSDVYLSRPGDYQRYYSGTNTVDISGNISNQLKLRSLKRAINLENSINPGKDIA